MSRQTRLVLTSCRQPELNLPRMYQNHKKLKSQTSDNEGSTNTFNQLLANNNSNRKLIHQTSPVTTVTAA